MDANSVKPSKLVSLMDATGLSAKQQRTAALLAAGGAAGVGCCLAVFVVWRNYRHRDSFFNGNSTASLGAKLQKSQVIINELRKVNEEMTALRQDVNGVKILVKQLRRDIAELRGERSGNGGSMYFQAVDSFHPVEPGHFGAANGYTEDDESELDFRSAKSDDGASRCKSPVRFAANTVFRTPISSPSEFLTARESMTSPFSVSSESDFRRLRPRTSREVNPEIFVEIDSQLDNLTDQAGKRLALQRLEELYVQNPGNVDVMWRLGRALYLESEVARADGNATQRRELAYRAKELCFAALARMPEPSAVVYRWCALTLGNLSDFESISNKIKQGYEFRNLVTKAIEIDPNDALSHYLLGRWFFACYQLTWYERKIAATLFATPPSATIDEALDEFLRCSELLTASGQTNWKENCLYIGKSYIEKRDYPEAVRWLKDGSTSPDIDEESRLAGEEIGKLLAQYGQYGA